MKRLLLGLLTTIFILSNAGNAYAMEAAFGGQSGNVYFSGTEVPEPTQEKKMNEVLPLIRAYANSYLTSGITLNSTCAYDLNKFWDVIIWYYGIEGKPWGITIEGMSCRPKKITNLAYAAFSDFNGDLSSFEQASYVTSGKVYFHDGIISFMRPVYEKQEFSCEGYQEHADGSVNAVYKLKWHPDDTKTNQVYLFSVLMIPNEHVDLTDYAPIYYTVKTITVEKEQPAVTPTPTVTKKAQPMTAKAKAVSVSYTKLKKKTQTVAASRTFQVQKAQGKVTYEKVSGNSKITVSKAGKLTIKKGLKKGTYKIRVKITAAGNSTYKAGAKTVTVKIKVK